MQRALIVALVVVASLGGSASVAGPLVVALQPLGEVSPAVVSTARDEMMAFWGVAVEVLPPRPLPQSAWYEPRRRYRADRLLDWLAGLTMPRGDRVVGLTAVDISITKGQLPDWGIFGLGQLGGRVCLVSTFRLASGRASAQLRRARLVKVLNHELGHTWGLAHCPTPQCLMGDCMGSIATVDAEPGELCASCRRRLLALGLRAGERALPPQ